MITSITGGTFAASANLGQAVEALHDCAKASQEDFLQMKGTFFELLGESLLDMTKVADDLELDATIASADECFKMMKRANVSSPGVYSISRNDVERLSWLLQAFRMNFANQMASRLVLVLGTKHSKYLTSEEPPFGREVEDVFPTASEDISEAAKCLSLQRPTAVVFHLMRAMESAVQRLASHLGILNVDREWGKLLSDINGAIEAMPKGIVRNGWSQSHTHLYHVKQAWRNDTMHPKTTYTEIQSEAVFEAVKSFMAHLAPLVSSQAQT